MTMPAPHHSIFYRPDALFDTQPTVSKHWRQIRYYTHTCCGTPFPPFPLLSVHFLIFCSFLLFPFLGHRLGDDLVDWNSGVSVRPYVRTSVRTSTKSFSDFHLIWCVDRPRSHMRTSVTSTRSKVKVKVTELPKLRKVHFSRSISSAVFAWSSKVTIGDDSTGPGLQLVGAWFLNFLPGKLSREFKCSVTLTLTLDGVTVTSTYTVHVGLAACPTTWL